MKRAGAFLITLLLTSGIHAFGQKNTSKLDQTASIRTLDSLIPCGVHDGASVE